MITLSNKFYNFVIDEAAGKAISFDLGKGNLLAVAQPPLISARFITEAGDFIEATSLQAEKCTASEQGDLTVLKYSGFDGFEAELSLEIRHFDSSPELSLRAEVKSELQLEWVEMPGISVENSFKENGGSSKLLWPYNEGMLVDSPADRMTHFAFSQPEYPSRGNYGMCPGMVSTPMIALISEKGGLYLGAHDKNQNTHFVDFQPFEDGVRLYMRVYPGVVGGNYKSDYDIVLSAFEGDWYTAADIYRNWFEANRSDRYIPIEKNPALPEWYGESPIIIPYCVRGHHDTDVMEPNDLFPYIEGLSVMDEIAEKTGSRVMALLMHWEGSAPWAPPYVWPPYGGEEKLKEYISALHEKGHLLGVYCSGLGWTQISNLIDYKKDAEFEFEGLKQYMCRSPKGDLPLSNICTAQRFGYDLCPSQSFCKETIAAEAEKMINADIDYVQLLDQNHGGTPYFCYAKDHGHPPVPGKWESEELIDIMSKIEKKKGDKKILFGCESAAAEVFIPNLLFSDNRFELNYMFGMPVPLYSYLYHRYVNNFMGNQVIGDGVMANCVTKDNLLYRMAYSFTCGDLLTIVINDKGQPQWSWGQRNFDPDFMPDSDKVFELARNMNAFRKGVGKKYLHTGKMVRPLTLNGISERELETVAGTKYIMPLQTSAFISDDGKFGQIVVNFTDKPVEFTVESDMELSVYRDSGKEAEPFAGSLTVPSLGVVLIEERKNND